MSRYIVSTVVQVARRVCFLKNKKHIRVQETQIKRKQKSLRAVRIDLGKSGHKRKKLVHRRCDNQYPRSSLSVEILSGSALEHMHVLSKESTTRSCIDACSVACFLVIFFRVKKKLTGILESMEITYMYKASTKKS